LRPGRVLAMISFVLSMVLFKMCLLPLFYDPQPLCPTFIFNHDDVYAIFCSCSFQSGFLKYARTDDGSPYLNIEH